MIDPGHDRQGCPLPLPFSFFPRCNPEIIMPVSRHERYMLTYKDRVPLLENMSSISVNGGFTAAGGIKDSEVS